MIPAILLFIAATAVAQETPTSTPVIIDEIGKLESVRDPKCYATASRLEDFMYGTPLEAEARFEKIALQKKFIRAAWEEASAAARAAGKTQVDPDSLRPVLQRFAPYSGKEGSDWTVRENIVITARDKRQYGSIAYALRAILAVQQDALLDANANLLPLDNASVQLMKEAIDLVSLAALQHADRDARKGNRDKINAELIRNAWNGIADVKAPVAKTARKAAGGEKFATIRAIVQEKLEAYSKYNDISMPVFLRNMQVYFARHGWPTDPEEGKKFKDQFTEVMIAWTSDVMLAADKHAVKAKHDLIRVEDVHKALQDFEPHELNAYEDVIYFPRLPKNERVVIEAYDLDAFRDPGVHWLYIDEALKDPNYKGTLEPDPFAAELIVEGAAQFGVLVLRVAGQFAEAENSQYLNTAQLENALKKIQTLLDKNAKMPARSDDIDRVVSAKTKTPESKGTYFTDVTTSAGIKFEHRQADWLARMIRSYVTKDGETAKLAVPPAFGGAGVAAEDIDNDGDDDILILSGAGNALYLNDKGAFRDVTESAGLVWKRENGTYGEPRQPIIADFDNDGWQDILITYVDDAHRLYRNKGNGTFEDVTAKTNLGGKGLVGGPATALDFDNDGLLDLYLGYFGDYIHGELPTLSRRNTNALPDKLFRNKGHFVFEDVSAGSGVENPGWAQSVGHVDFDEDGREDLICGNDFGVNAWYRNLGGGKFEDVSAKYGTDKPSYTMNVGITDLNRDGYPDVYISNVVTMNKDEKYVLPSANMRMKFDPKKLANMRVVEANDLFASVTQSGKLAQWEQSGAIGRGKSSTGWSWDADFFDFDNDGDDDLYVVNGMNEYAVYSSVNPYFTDSTGAQRDIIMPVADAEESVFFVNSGGKLNEESKKSGANRYGNSRSVAYLDSDDDGDLDMVLNNFNTPAEFYRNNSESLGNHWLKIKLTGDPSKNVSRDAIGARILVDTKSQKGLWREVFSTIGYLSVHPKEQHFGLGADKKANVTVIWPNGERETFADIAADRRYEIVQGKGITRP
ncbi:MAG TPA: CRTAC1 family protein [Thermoanaerobaculia bacterium]|nr:CRTAC1 family protein [Thermoanaerobaculia bacterium]